MLDPIIRERVAASFARQRLMALYGAKLTAMDSGYLEITVPATDALLRTNGIFHGGVIAALADSAAGYAATTLYPEDVSMLTVEFKVNFLSPAMGDSLIARGKIIRNGATLTVAQSDLYSGDKHVATALVTLIKANV
jgi:uncharacterized protein (TIGR00369 family)